MKTTDKQKLHQSTVKELEGQLVKLSAELTAKHQEVKLGRAKNPKIVSHLRRQIAVIKTIITAKQLATN